MTIDSDSDINGSTSPSSTAPSGSEGSDRPGAKEMASAAKDESAAVAHTAVDSGKDVAREATAQASAVVGQAKEQLGVVVGQAKGELSTQVDARSQQAAAGLQTLADQLSALAGGRPDEAGHVGTLVNEAQQRVQSYAATLQQRGPQALVDDIASFARRRPLRFLALAGVAGFAAGRLTRSGVAVAKEQSDDAPAALSTGYGATSTTDQYTGQLGTVAG